MVSFIQFVVHKGINIRLENLNNSILKKKRIGIQAKLNVLFVDMKKVIVGSMIQIMEKLNVEVVEQL